MTELEQAQRALDVMEILAYVGFILWGCTGWYVGRTLLRKYYIKPGGLINMKLVRQIEDDNFHKNEEIKELKKQLEVMEDHNKRLWYWSYNPHRDAEFITITQLDEEGEEVAVSQINLPERKDWVEPMAYADDHYESYQQWKDSLPHNQEKQ